VLASAQQPGTPGDAGAVPVRTADPGRPAEAARPGGPPKAKGIPTDPLEMMEAIGWLSVSPFIAASFIALWFGIERLVVLRRGRVIPRAFVERFLDHLDKGKLEPVDAVKLCEQNDSPVAHIFAHAVRKWGKPSVEVEQAVIDGGERQVAQLRKHLRVLNGVSTVTPLIGLFGTVVGMIMAFNEIGSSQAMGKAEQLAGGIGMALLTTAFGLGIAIPALVIYLYFVGRVDSLVLEMDELAQSVVNRISAEGLAARAAEARSKPKKPAASVPEPAVGKSV
jgi:biopolymer transport protein ExbB